MRGEGKRADKDGLATRIPEVGRASRSADAAVMFERTDGQREVVLNREVHRVVRRRIMKTARSGTDRMTYTGLSSTAMNANREGDRAAPGSLYLGGLGGSWSPALSAEVVSVL